MGRIYWNVLVNLRCFQVSFKCKRVAGDRVRRVVMMGADVGVI